MLHGPSMLTYACLSFALAFVNKALFELANFRSSLIVIFFQLVFIIISFQILAYIRLITLPSITENDLCTLIIPSIFYCLTTIFSLQALMKLNIAIYLVIKRCTPAFTFILSVIILKKQKFDIKSGLCVFIITIGAVITSIDDVSFHLQSYVTGSFSVIFHSLYLLTIQRYSEQKTSNEVLYINSLLSLPMISLTMLLFSDEFSYMKSYEGYNTIQFWLYFLLSTIGGGLLNGATFWCTIKNSALTTSIVGVMKSILQVFFGMFAFDRLVINNKTMLGIVLSLIGGTIFSYLEYRNKKTKSILTTSDNDDVIEMNLNCLFILIWSLVISSVICNKSCSREDSRIVRDYFTQALGSIYEKNHVSIAFDCIFLPKYDIFYDHELNKVKITNGRWLCKYCNKTFSSENYLDIHLSNRHNDTLVQNEQSVCLSDYCSIFRCDVLKQPRKSIRSLNPLARGSDVITKKTKKIINEQQLTILRSRCASIINQCIPHNINHDTRVKMQHEMYAEVCAYLTSNKYFELPKYLRPIINFTTIFWFTIFISMCIIGIGIAKHSDWKFNNNDEDESEKHLSDEAISTATALLSKSPANSIIHSSKNSTSTIRHRVRFKSLDEYQHSHL